LKIIAGVAEKGGVGKTTTALALAQFAASRRLRTALLDIDDQGNATGSLVPIDDTLNHKNAYDLVSTPELDESFAPMKVSEYLVLIPASNQLMQLDREDFDLFFRLGERLRALFENRLDLIVVDTPGHVGPRVTATLVACDAVYSPTELNQYSMQSLMKVLALIKKVRGRLNPGLDFLGLVLNRVGSISTEAPYTPVEVSERDIYEQLKSNESVGPSKILGLIAQRQGIGLTLSSGKGLHEIPGSASGKRGVEELERFATTVLTKVGLL